MDGKEEWLASTFVELADTLVADFDLLDFLSVLVTRCTQLLDSTEVGLALADTRGQLRVVASSTERMRVLELVEEQNDEGPCWDCFRTGTPVLNQRLGETEDRWPGFASHARAAGFQVVHALPLRLRANTIGAMNVFNVNVHSLTSQEVHLTQALADVATIGILQERAIRQGVELATQLQGALNSRIVIEQAKGTVAERLKVGMDEAFQMIRNYARKNQRRLSDVASALIDNTLQEGDLLTTPLDDSVAARKRPS